MTEPAPQSWTIWPHRSMTPRVKHVVLGGTTAVSAAMAGLFVMNGLWPLALFAAIPPVGLAFGLAASARSGREYETLTLHKGTLTVARHRPGHKTPDVTAIPAYMLRVETVMEDMKGMPDDTPARCNKILLRAQGKTWEIGAFLHPVEKEQFARVLRSALDRYNRGQPRHAPHP